MANIALTRKSFIREAVDTFIEWRAVKVFREMMRVRLAKVSFVILAIAILAAIFAPVVVPRDPYGLDTANSLSKPSSTYWLGADRLGRDQLSRLIYGARVSLIIGTASVAISVAAAIAIGTVAGYFGKWSDEILMRIMDAIAAFPGLLLALGLVAITGGAMLNVIIAIAVTSTPGKARLIRSQVLSVKERDYTLAAKAIGAPSSRIILSYLIPNSLAPVIVAATLSLGVAIITEASLSFLGVGVKPPTPTWGGMLRHAFETVERAPWLTFSPGLAIFIVVLAFNFLGDALRDVLDPRLKGTR
jgi:peptide/nickel transport system permease protein